METVYRAFVRQAAVGHITPKAVKTMRSVGQEKYLRAFNAWMDKELRARGIMVEPRAIDWMSMMNSLIYGKVHNKEKAEEFRHEIVGRMFGSYSLTYAKAGEPIHGLQDPKEHPPYIENLIKAFRKEAPAPEGTVEDPSETVLISVFVPTLQSIYFDIKEREDKADYLVTQRGGVEERTPILKEVPDALVSLEGLEPNLLFRDLREFVSRRYGQPIDQAMAGTHPPEHAPKGLATAAQKTPPSPKEYANLVFFTLRRFLEEALHFKMEDPGQRGIAFNRIGDEVARELGATRTHVLGWLHEAEKIGLDFIAKEHLKEGARVNRILRRWAIEVGYAS